MIMRRFRVPTRLRGLAPALLAVLALESGMGPGTPANAQAQPLTVDRLVQMSGPELDAVYRQGAVVGIPAGRVRGTALLARARDATGRWPRARAWSGRARSSIPAGPLAVNRFFGLPLIRAQVIRTRAGSTVRLPSSSTTAGPRECMPGTATRSARSPPASSSASCTPAPRRRRSGCTSCLKPNPDLTDPAAASSPRERRPRGVGAVASATDPGARSRSSPSKGNGGPTPSRQ